MQLGDELASPPEDGIVSLRFSPSTSSSDLLVTSWDKTLRLYDVKANKLKSCFKQAGPVFAACFQDSMVAFGAGMECAVKRYDLSTGSEQVVGRHDAPVRCVEYDQDTGLLMTGSWDCTLRCWDPRSNSMVANLRQPYKVFSMSLGGSRVVVATAHRAVNVYEKRMLHDGAEPEQKRESSLKYQTRCVSCYPDGTGYALSSVEGRVAMEFFDTDPEVQAKKYAFKCHRKSEGGRDIVYPVNTLAFHPTHGTFVSGGCDGLVNIWDGANKKRLHQYAPYPTSISALAFSADGALLAVASSYTFELGAQAQHPADSIYVRTVDREVMPKPKPPPR